MAQSNLSSCELKLLVLLLMSRPQRYTSPGWGSPHNVPHSPQGAVNPKLNPFIDTNLAPKDPETTDVVRLFLEIERALPLVMAMGESVAWSPYHSIPCFALTLINDRELSAMERVLEEEMVAEVDFMRSRFHTRLSLTTTLVRSTAMPEMERLLDVRTVLGVLGRSMKMPTQCSPDAFKFSTVTRMSEIAKELLSVMVRG